MINPDKNSLFWQYLSPGQKGLIDCGLNLIKDLNKHPNLDITDYSYLVFPFAKAYEGFLKQYFRDLVFITELEYSGTHFRIGKALNPHLEKYLRAESVYDKLVLKFGSREIADKMWDIWKRGRNLVFHYFPHNLRALSQKEAEKIIEEILAVIEISVDVCKEEILTLISSRPS